MASELINNTMRLRNLPHIWCPGCGNGILMRDVAQAITNLGLDRDKVVIVSGIGCSSRAAGYMNYNTLHTTHGRAIAFATGIKMAKPELTVIVITGDGDSSAIGGNHLIHAARRNIDLTVVVFNNNIYGMTGGQFSPTTPTGSFATTAPYGSIDRTFDLPTLAMLRRPGLRLPRAPDHQAHPGRYRPQGLRPHRLHGGLPHLLRPQEQEGRRREDDDLAEGERGHEGQGRHHDPGGAGRQSRHRLLPQRAQRARVHRGVHQAHRTTEEGIKER